MKVKSILNIANIWFKDSKYEQDRAILKKFTGAELTEKQFNSYKDKLTLRGDLGSDSDIQKKYYAFGIPSGFSSMDVANHILNTLAGVGLKFYIEENQNEALFKKLLDNATLCLTQDQWPRLPLPYKSSPRLSNAVKKVRESMNLTYMEQVL